MVQGNLEAWKAGKCSDTTNILFQERSVTALNSIAKSLKCKNIIRSLLLYGSLIYKPSIDPLYL